MCTENTSERRSAPHRFACIAHLLWAVYSVCHSLADAQTSHAGWCQELCSAVLFNLSMTQLASLAAAPAVPHALT